MANLRTKLQMDFDYIRGFRFNGKPIDQKTWNEIKDMGVTEAIEHLFGPNAFSDYKIDFQIRDLTVNEDLHLEYQELVQKITKNYEEGDTKNLEENYKKFEEVSRQIDFVNGLTRDPD